jgi:glycosyltransferase involved in cell wall biosynthesis
LEGKIPREHLVDLLTTHRYGIHGMEYEHFGIAVAEFLAAGMIPFVPNSGGQVEIVDRHDAVTYDSVDEVVAKADQVLSSPEQQWSIRSELPDVERRFGPERFKRQIQSVVAYALESTSRTTLHARS